MNLFVTEVVTPPEHLPVEVAAADQALAAAVVEEIERVVLWRGLVRQTRRITVDGPLAAQIELEPATITSITRWSPTDAASVIDADNYHVISRDPQGTVIEPLPWYSWPEPQRAIGSFAVNYECGWTVTPETALLAGDAVNEVPASVRFMVERAVSFRAGAGLGNIGIGSLRLDVEPSYSTDKLPKEIASIGRAFQYRPGIFAARP